jgi:hypothetical protein
MTNDALLARIAGEFDACSSKMIQAPSLPALSSILRQYDVLVNNCGSTINVPVMLQLLNAVKKRGLTRLGRNLIRQTVGSCWMSAVLNCILAAPGSFDVLLTAICGSPPESFIMTPATCADEKTQAIPCLERWLRRLLLGLCVFQYKPQTTDEAGHMQQQDKISTQLDNVYGTVYRILRNKYIDYIIPAAAAAAKKNPQGPRLADAGTVIDSSRVALAVFGVVGIGAVRFTTLGPAWSGPMSSTTNPARIDVRAWSLPQNTVIQIHTTIPQEKHDATLSKTCAAICQLLGGQVLISVRPDAVGNAIGSPPSCFGDEFPEYALQGHCVSLKNHAVAVVPAATVTAAAAAEKYETLNSNKPSAPSPFTINNVQAGEVRMVPSPTAAGRTRAWGSSIAIHLLDPLGVMQDMSAQRTRIAQWCRDGGKVLVAPLNTTTTTTTTPPSDNDIDLTSPGLAIRLSYTAPSIRVAAAKKELIFTIP